MGEKKEKEGPGVVLLKDLVPRKTVKGGTGKLVFGQQAEAGIGAERPPEEASAERPEKAKGGE